MKKINNLLLVISVLILTACVSDVTYEGYANFRQENRSKLMNVELGMTKQEVVKQMGSNSYGEISNPWKREILGTTAGTPYDVLYYYTEYINYAQAENWEAGVTPVVFKNNKVIGTGWQFLDGLGIRSVSTYKKR